jgi:hypothetical protein
MTEKNVTPRVLDSKFKDAEVPADAQTQDVPEDENTHWIVVKDDEGKDERMTMDEFKERGL